MCNALIEELANLEQWTRYSSEQVMSKTQTLLTRSVELAQTAEAQMARFSDTTETVEKLVAFIQRLSSTLHLNIEIVAEIRKHLPPIQTGQLDAIQPAQSLESSRRINKLLDRLNADTQRQEQLLNQLLDSAQANATLAESMVSELYTVAQRIYQSSTAILQTVEHIHSLAKLAQQWNNSIAGFQLPEETVNYEEAEKAYEEAVVPIPSGILRRNTDTLA
jgi:methyl-accepting chemotaxis protein